MSIPSISKLHLAFQILCNLMLSPMNHISSVSSRLRHLVLAATGRLQMEATMCFVPSTRNTALYFPITDNNFQVYLKNVGDKQNPRCK